jgi:tetratricopeptide (TPR) repeat protein
MLSSLRQVSRITIGLLTSALMWVVAPANATEQGTDQFIVRVYSNGLGSQELLGGHYDAALAQIETSRGLDEASRFEAATNLCVAHMMAGRFDSARSACDKAVKSARSSAIATPHWGPPAGGAHQQDVAIAYANRAVLHWLTDDAQSAANDLAQAKRLSPKADFVTHNVTALQSSHSAIAQVQSVL